MSTDGGWEIPLDEVDPENIGVGGNFPAPGKYHVEVTQVDPDTTSSGGKPQMKVEYEILAGDVEGQEGKTQYDYYAKTPKAFPRALQFAIAAGLTTKEELSAAKTAGTAPRIPFGMAIGRQLCVEIVEEEYEGKTRNKVQFGLWHLNDPEAKDIPKNAGKLAQLGDAAPDPMQQQTADKSVF